jgi:hypothetical protein
MNVNEKNQTTEAIEAKLNKALEILKDFTQFFEPEETQFCLWKMLETSLISPEADAWDSKLRADLLFTYTKLTEVAGALHCLFPMFTDKDFLILNPKHLNCETEPTQSTDEN